MKHSHTLKMSLPPRCFTCGKVIGQYEETFKTSLSQSIPVKEILDTFGLQRYCCRRMFLGYVDIIDQLLLFPKDIDMDYRSKQKDDN